MFSGSGLYVLDKMSHQNISFFPPIIGKVALTTEGRCLLTCKMHVNCQKVEFKNVFPEK